ncbi:hypothetical protein BDC45DRAFT_531283 [Circinella umbellata]|nr:hypothetical protein BDC45DRAFT_531283 [Circinella umbellata]
MLSCIITTSPRIMVQQHRPMMMFIASTRPYTMTPSVPQSGSEGAIKKEDNDIHSLYNKDNVSMLEVDHHDSTQHRSLSDGSNHSGESADSFSPSFNTVFDE